MDNYAGKVSARTGTAWTPEETTLLTTLYPNAPQREILAALPTRAWSAITCKAYKLNLQRSPEAVRATQVGSTRTEETRRRIAAAKLRTWQQPGFKERRVTEMQANKQPLTYEQQQLIRGTAMGDGCLWVNHANAKLIVEHYIPDREYLFWKHQVLQSSGIAQRAPFLRNGTSYGKPYQSWRLVTRTHPFITDVWRTLYKDHKRHITPQILDPIDELGLAVWYMDDGYLSIRDAPSYAVDAGICTDAYGEDGAWTVRNWIEERWGVSFRVQRASKAGQWRVMLSQRAETERFLSIIRPFQAPAMERKFRQVRSRKTGAAAPL